MHVLFVHQNYPAKFGHIARHLIRTRGWSCSFVSKTPGGIVDGIRKIEYTTTSGARETTHYCSRTFENAIWHSHGVYEACKAHPDLRPDLIVGHSGFGSTLFLPELYPGVPIINYFEFYYHPHHSDMDFRPEFPPAEIDYLRARAQRNAPLGPRDLSSRLQPDALSARLFPETYRSKIEVIFDGIETDIFEHRPAPPGRRSVDPRVDADRHLREPRVRIDAWIRSLHESRPGDLSPVSRRGLRGRGEHAGVLWRR